MPVWFVLEGGKLYLLPVQGSETQWYKNVMKKPTIRVDARGVEAEFQAKPLAKETGGFDKELRYPGEDDVYENPKMDALKL